MLGLKIFLRFLKILRVFKRGFYSISYIAENSRNFKGFLMNCQRLILDRKCSYVKLKMFNRYSSFP